MVKSAALPGTINAVLYGRRVRSRYGITPIDQVVDPENLMPNIAGLRRNRPRIVLRPLSDVRRHAVSVREAVLLAALVGLRSEAERSVTATAAAS